MKSPQAFILEKLIKKPLEALLEEPDLWNYELSAGIPGYGISGTNGVEASAEEVAAKLGADLKSGELFHIGSEVSLDVNAGIPLETAKNWAALRAFERRGFNIATSVPTPGTRTSAKSVPHEVDVNIPASPEALMNMSIENWANHDVGMAVKEALRLGATNPISIALTAKIDDWYGLSSNRSMGIKSASAVSQAQTNTPTPTAPQQNQVANTATQTPSPTANRTVTIKAGDTISQLAQTHDTTVDALMTLNPQITNKHEIYINEKISVPAPSAPRPLRAAPLPPRKPSPPSLLTNNHNLNALNIPDKAAPATITSVPMNAWMTNTPLTKTPRNKGFEAGLVGLGMTPKEAKEALANYSLGPGNSIGPAPKQLQQPAQPEPSLGMFQNKQQLEKSVRQNQGPTVDAKAYLDAAVYGRSRLDSIINPNPTTPSRTAAISAEDSAPQAAAVGANLTNADMQKVMKTRLMGNLVAQDKSYLFDVEKGYFSEQERVKEARLAEMGRLQDQTNKTVADRVKEADIKAARLATNTMPTMKIGDPSVSLDLSPFTSTKNKQTTLGQKSLLGGVDNGLQDKGGVHSITDPTETQKSIARAVAQIAQHRVAKKEAEKNMSWQNKSWSTMTAAERNKSIAAQFGRKSYFGDPDRGYGEANGHGVAGHAKSGSAYGAAMGISGDITGRTDEGAKDGKGADTNTRVICTELVRQGRMDPHLQRLDIAFTLKKISPTMVKGYHFWAIPYVQLMRKSPLATAVIDPFASWRALEISYRMGNRTKPHLRGRLVRLIGEPICWMLGWMIEALAGEYLTAKKAV